MQQFLPGKTVVAILSLLLLSLYACDTPVEEEPEDPGDEVAEFYVDEETAVTVAENVLFLEAERAEAPKPGQFTADNYTVSKDVETIVPIDNEEEQNVMYVVNYSEPGFVILSADRRVEPVLAHSAANDFSFDDEIYSPGLVDWMIDTKEFIERVRLGDKSDGESRQMELLWEQFVDLPTPVTYLGADVACDPDEGYAETYGPLLETEWGQGCGFNDNLEANCPDRECDRYPTGCVATAMAKLAHFWEQPYENAGGAVAIHDWDEMPLTNVSQGDSDELPWLMENMGELVDMDYGCDGSGASSGDAFDAFVDNFEFSNTEDRDLTTDSDYDRLADEIEDGRPVYLRGCDAISTDFGLFETYEGCHAWIADGKTDLFNCDETIREDTQEIHMNWGWGSGGDNNGNYKVKGEDGSYGYDREMFYQIYPTD